MREVVNRNRAAQLPYVSKALNGSLKIKKFPGRIRLTAHTLPLGVFFSFLKEFYFIFELAYISNLSGFYYVFPYMRTVHFEQIQINEFFCWVNHFFTSRNPSSFY
jgi:hypothetical protein